MFGSSFFAIWEKGSDHCKGTPWLPRAEGEPPARRDGRPGTQAHPREEGTDTLKDAGKAGLGSGRGSAGDAGPTVGCLGHGHKEEASTRQHYGGTPWLQRAEGAPAARAQGDVYI